MGMNSSLMTKLRACEQQEQYALQDAVLPYPMKPMMKKPTVVAMAIFWNSFASGLEHFCMRVVSKIPSRCGVARVPACVAAPLLNSLRTGKHRR